MAASKSKDAEALTREQAEALYERIRAIESLEADRKEIADDINAQKILVVETLPIQKDVLDFVLKRRKHSKGILNNFDTMLQLVEEALHEVEEEHGEEVRERIAAAHRKHAQGEQLELAAADDQDENGEEADGELEGELERDPFS